MKRLPGLDGIRGLAILLVLVWHYLACQIDAESRSLPAYFDRALSLTWSGVDLFFVLSGFLIAGILIDQRAAPNYFFVFYVRRACRILPLYFLLLALFLCFSTLAAAWGLAPPAFEWLFAQPFPLWSYATFTQNFYMGVKGDFGPHWLGVTWSLAVEEQFYLLMPLLIYFLPRTRVLYVFGAAVLLAPLLRIGTPGFYTFVHTPWRADSLLAGACLALLVRSPLFWSAAVRHKRFLFALLAILLAGAALMTVRLAAFGALSHLWLAGLYMTLILLVVVDADGFLGRILSHRLLVWFGTLSYGIYLFHQVVSGLLHGLLRGAAPAIKSPADAGITILALLVTVSLAAVLYRFFEMPFLQLGHRFHYLPAPAVARQSNLLGRSRGWSERVAGN